MEEYIEKLISQIRCKKARPYIKYEIKEHIEEQIAANLFSGMSAEDAENNAVKDMGDPVEVGISMDKIHKPRISWRILVIVSILSILGFIIQCSIINKVNVPGAYQNSIIYHNSMLDFASAILLGFILMCAIYFVDYTEIAKYSKIIAFIIITLEILALTGFFGNSTNLGYRTIGFGIFRISASALLMFYVPVYGGILYKYRNGGMLEFLKAIVWFIIPVFIMFRLPNVTVAIILFISMLILLTVSLLKGWFKVNVKRVIISLWTIFTVIPAAVLHFMYEFDMLSEYKASRITSFFSESGEQSYLTSILREFCENITWIGSSGNDVIGSVPNYDSDFIFSYILNNYGIMAGIIIAAVLTGLVIIIFGSATKQKNELGMVMGVGCGMILMLNILINLLGSIGVLPPVSSFLPFFSVGRSNIILSYALVGVVMSIYRYKDIYPKSVAEKVR